MSDLLGFGLVALLFVTLAVVVTVVRGLRRRSDEYLMEQLRSPALNDWLKDSPIKNRPEVREAYERAAAFAPGFPGWSGPGGVCEQRGWTPATPEAMEAARGAGIEGFVIATDADGAIYYIARPTTAAPEASVRVRRADGADEQVATDLMDLLARRV